MWASFSCVQHHILKKKSVFLKKRSVFTFEILLFTLSGSRAATVSNYIKDHHCDKSCNSTQFTCSLTWQDLSVSVQKGAVVNRRCLIHTAMCEKKIEGTEMFECFFFMIMNTHNTSPVQVLLGEDQTQKLLRIKSDQTTE